MARPTKLTPERQQRIIDALLAGNYFETSCRYAGIHPATAYGWMAKGERQPTGPYREFFEAIKRAEAQAEVLAVAEVRKAWSDSWQAAMTWLERKFADRWGRRDRIQLNLHQVETEALMFLEHLAEPLHFTEEEKARAIAEVQRVLREART